MRRSFSTVLVLVALLAVSAQAHDIPNARVDRSIQATIRPGRLEIDYEVSLAELTLVQDLRSLVGSLPGGDRQALYQRYGELTGPLDAKGFLVSVDDGPIDLHFRGFDLVVEEHPRYTFHFEAAIPERGKLAIHDTNYVASEGTSRLALRRLAGVEVSGDDVPQDVGSIPIRPVWQLSDAEERRTKHLVVQYKLASIATRHDAGEVSRQARPVIAQGPPADRDSVRPKASGLARLLDRAATAPLLLLCVIAVGLGAAHAVQPGHGKSLVAAATVGERGGWVKGSLLAAVITLAHMAGVLVVAAALWATRSSRYGDINRGLAEVAGFTIAAIGLWRLGRHLAGYGEHDEIEGVVELGPRGLVSLGVAGGLVPCWDAIVLIILAEAVGRLGIGLVLLAAFSAGMAGVLVAVGLVAARLRDFATRWGGEGRWERRLGLWSAAVLTALGLYLMIV
ncbi:MAG TPA: ABC transporter permease [Isosphaeraceae bacterium]|jgi:ABC-type nickel/cobalt efflux system permease component RcnA|nr:ABC transporter permease [Isosphaeraceae bacterium]